MGNLREAVREYYLNLGYTRAGFTWTTKGKNLFKVTQRSEEGNQTKTSGKHNSDGTTKQKTAWSNLLGKKNKECKTFGKKHAGKCWHLDTGASKNSTATGPRFKKDLGFTQKESTPWRKK